MKTRLSQPVPKARDLDQGLHRRISIRAGGRCTSYKQAGEPLWRETGDGHGTTLVVTDAGLLAIGIEPVVASVVDKALEAKPKLGLTLLPVTADPPKPVAIRGGTKQAQIISMLQRPDGVTIAEMVAATGWQPHTARAAISGALKKKLALPITSLKVEGRGTVYWLN